MRPYNNPTYQRNRASILAGSPLCHWCQRNPATQADHLIELDAGGDHSLENLVPSCASCNASRGTRYINTKTAQRIQARNTALSTPDQSVTLLEQTTETREPLLVKNIT